MMNRPGADAGTEARLRTMRILWAAQLMTVGLLVVVGSVVRSETEGVDARGADVPTLLYALAAAAAATVVASFVVKPIFYGRAAARREPAQAQTGLILALALCEAAALLGFAGLLITRSDYAFLLFALGALGMLLHFPRREQVEAAFRTSSV